MNTTFTFRSSSSLSPWSVAALAFALLTACASKDKHPDAGMLGGAGASGLGGAGAAGAAGSAGTAGAAGAAGVSGSGGAGGAAGAAGSGGQSHVLRGHIAVQPLGGCVLDAQHHASCWNGYDDPFKDQQLAYSKLALGTLSAFCALTDTGSTLCSDGTDFSPTTRHWSDIATFGRNVVCGLEASGAIACEPVAGNELGPAPLPAGPFASLSGASPVICGVLQSGAVACGVPGAATMAIAVPALSDATQVSVGDKAACALRQDGSVVCWNLVGGTNVPSASGHYAQISVGNDGYLCGVRLDGTAGCEGSQADATRQPPAGKFLEVAANGAGACGIQSDGNVDCWGGVPDPSSPVMAGVQ